MNLTSIVAVLEIIIGIVAFLVPAIGVNATVASGLIALGLSTLGISQKVSAQTLGGKSAW